MRKERKHFDFIASLFSISTIPGLGEPTSAYAVSLGLADPVLTETLLISKYYTGLNKCKSLFPFKSRSVFFFNWVHTRVHMRTQNAKVLPLVSLQ